MGKPSGTPALLLLLLLATSRTVFAESASVRRLLRQIRYDMQQTPATPASLDVQLAEAYALLQLKSALNDHPVFAGFTPDPTNPLYAGLSSGAWGAPSAGSVGGDQAPPSATPCATSAQWAWVYCDASSRVVGIDLQGPNVASVNVSWSAGGAHPITGHIPWGQLAPLGRLQYLNLGHQAIRGDLVGVGSLPAVTNLTLTDNRISGSIPDEVSKITTLVQLSLAMNHFSGSLPSALASLPALASLDLASNSLGGAFPEWIGNVTTLQWLSLASNALSGNLPASWSRLTGLTGLQLQLTTVQGSVPSSWSALSSLSHVSLVGVGLRSPYPEFLSHLPDLQDVWLSRNYLYGPLPSDYIKPTMRTLNIDDNYFNGLLPELPPDARGSLYLRADLNCFSQVAGFLGYSPRDLSACNALYSSLAVSRGDAQATSEGGQMHSGVKTFIVVAIVLVVITIVWLGILVLVSRKVKSGRVQDGQHLIDHGN